MLIASAVQAQSPTGTSPTGTTTMGTPAAGGTSAAGDAFSGRFVAANGSGVSGTAALALSGGNLTIDVNASGLDPESRHEMHIHLGPTCPGEPAGGPGATSPGSSATATGTTATGTAAPGSSTNTADTNGDGFLDSAEALKAGGNVLLPLDDDPSNQDEDTFPRSDSSGRITYHETVALDDLLTAIAGTDDDLTDNVGTISGGNADWASYVVEIHGVADTMTLPDTVAKEPGKSAHESLPVACANLEAGSGAATGTPATSATGSPVANATADGGSGSSTFGNGSTGGTPVSGATSSPVANATADGGSGSSAFGNGSTGGTAGAGTSTANSAATPSGTSAPNSAATATATSTPAASSPAAGSTSGAQSAASATPSSTNAAGAAGSGGNPAAPDSGTGLASAEGTNPLIALGAAFMAASLGLLGLSYRRR
ncbi:MAG: hypothetical protein IT302_12505 [Dehalococcoidia bacterium]|nr:hypothetical protein [Dehalococcoidia bacterium]